MDGHLGDPTITVAGAKDALLQVIVFFQRTNPVTALGALAAAALAIALVIVAVRVVKNLL